MRLREQLNLMLDLLAEGIMGSDFLVAKGGEVTISNGDKGRITQMDGVIVLPLGFDLIMRLKYLNTGEIEIEIEKISPKQFVIVRIEGEENFISLSADSEETEKKAVITLPEGKAAQINFGRSGWGVKITMDEIVNLLTEGDPFNFGEPVLAKCLRLQFFSPQSEGR
jgi:hypothetical protein